MNRRRQVPSPRVPHRSSMEEGCSRNCGDGDRRRDRDQGSGARKLPRRGEVSRTRHRHSGGGLSLWLVAVSLACLCLCQGAWALGLGSVALRVKAKAKAKGNRGRISLYRLNNNRYNATCLDGGPPGYYLSRGWGTGETSWVFYLQGGAWCSTLKTCAQRASTPLGSTRYWPEPTDPDFESILKKRKSTFTGILSSDAAENPTFYNWNKVMVFYCDGGGFVGDRTGVPYNASFSLNFHGQRIVLSVMHDLIGRHGLRRAQNVLITGCSAGGQAVSMVCDSLGSRFPRKARVKCLMDAGFFLDTVDLNGKPSFRLQTQQMVALQNMRGGFDAECQRAMPPRLLFKCFFPQYNLMYITRPVFIVNSIVDYAAIFILNDASGTAAAAEAVRCFSGGTIDFGLKKPQKGNSSCTPKQAASLAAYRRAVYLSISRVVNGRPGFGAFLFPDVKHCTTIYGDWVNQTRSGTALVPAVTKWFYQ